MPSVCHRAVLAGAVLACTVAVLSSLALPGTPAAAQDDPGEGRVLRTTVDGPITPVIDDHLADAVARAEDGGYVALVVEIDTPGGLDSSMRGIVQGFLAAEVVQAWIRGDLGFAEEQDLPMRLAHPALHERMLVERNRAWTPRIEAMLAEPATRSSSSAAHTSRETTASSTSSPAPA